MSFTVTCGGRSEEFALTCDIRAIQAYFGVRGGGLVRNGVGPVSTRVYDGFSYELRGCEDTPNMDVQKVQKAKMSNGKALVADVVWDFASSDAKGGKGKLAADDGSEDSLRKKAELAQVLEKQKGEVKRLDAQVHAKDVEWAIVGASFACIVMFTVTLMWYLCNYDPVQELSLREHADPMTVESLTAILLSFSFGCLAFFH